MRFSTAWRDEVRNAALEERATVADLRLWLGDQNVTQHFSEAGPSDHVTVALYGMAEGLAHDWWSLFGGRDRVISLRRYRGGYVVPDVRMTFDGAAFELSAHQDAFENPGVRFWAGPSEVMARPDAEALLSEFIERVLGRMQSRGVASTSAALRWARVQASRDDPDEAEFCEAAGALGLDPYQVGEREARSIEDAAALFRGEPLNELLAGAAGADQASLVAWVRQSERRRPSASRVADLSAVAAEAAAEAPAQEGGDGWALGYRRARAVRKAMSIADGARFQTFRPLAESLGAARSFELARPVDGIKALRSDAGDGVHIHMRSLGSAPWAQASHLFTFARAVGDAACFPAAARSPVNELQSAYRQAAGRAFAAELLAPAREVKSMRGDRRDLDAIASEFGVSTTTIGHQIENHSRIEEACAGA